MDDLSKTKSSSRSSSRLYFVERTHRNSHFFRGLFRAGAFLGDAESLSTHGAVDFFFRFPGDNCRRFVARKPYKNGGLNVNELLKLGKRKIKKWHTDPTQKRTQLIGFEQRHWFWVIGCMWWSEVLLRKFRNFEKWWLEDHFPFKMVLFREHVSSLKIRFGWPSSVFIALCQDHEARWLIRNQSLSEFWKSHMQ